MSNLSEEEIIIDAKEFINNIKEILNEGNNDLTKKVETDFYTLQVVLQGLLDLYKKEKEKNEYKDKIIKGLGLDVIPRTITNFNEMIDKYYTSNDKLKDYFYNKRTYRQFELQQEYKDFKDDIKLNTIDEIEKELLEE